MRESVESQTFDTGAVATELPRRDPALPLRHGENAENSLTSHGSHQIYREHRICAMHYFASGGSSPFSTPRLVRVYPKSFPE
jgi:hypothetical protein